MLCQEQKEPNTSQNMFPINLTTFLKPHWHKRKQFRDFTRRQNIRHCTFYPSRVSPEKFEEWSAMNRTTPPPSQNVFSQCNTNNILESTRKQSFSDRAGQAYRRCKKKKTLLKIKKSASKHHQFRSGLVCFWKILWCGFEKWNLMNLNLIWFISVSVVYQSRKLPTPF